VGCAHHDIYGTWAVMMALVVGLGIFNHLAGNMRPKLPAASEAQRGQESSSITKVAPE